MVVKIIAEVPVDEEPQFLQALEDSDFTWMQALDLKWLEVERDDGHEE